MLTAVAISAPIGAFRADWSSTHVFNPRWPPHAKFHNGQTMASAVELSALALWQLWGPRRRTQESVRWATLLIGLYPATQAPAILFPGAAVVDPEFADQLPVIAGIRLNQLMGLVVFAPVLAVAHALARTPAQAQGAADTA